MKHLLISPRIAIQKGDFLGSGIPYWPIELATFAAFLRERGSFLSVVDLFGSAPKELEDRGDYYLQGMSYRSALSADALADVDVAIVYALSYMSHREILEIIAFLRSSRPNLAIAVLENSQAVTAYALPFVAEDFFDAGADLLLCGEVYWNWEKIELLVTNKESPCPGNVLTRVSERPYSVCRQVEKVPSYPIPAWDLFPVQSYWSLPYSHGPKTKTFLPIFTSRGCPYPCDFCVVPETNRLRWRARRASEVVNEIIFLKDRYGVHDFQIEDLNPTVKSSRIDEIAQLLLERNASIRFYIVSGTKAETVPLESVQLWARAGCRYISISPESGSSGVMRQIGKPFDYDYGKELVAACRRHGVFTQACFIVGHPSESVEDFDLSVDYLRTLVRNGLDEVAVFVVSPFAGSKLYQQDNIALSAADSLVSFSPKGRANYTELSKRRQRMISVFFAEKLKKGLSLWTQGFRALFGVPATKMENLPKRIMYIYYLVARHKLRQFFLGSQIDFTPHSTDS